MRAPSAVLAILGLMPAAARADVVDSPPPCPDGTLGVSDHGGGRCLPSVCAADSECSDGQRCREAGLCIREESHRVYRSFPPMEGDEGEMRVREVVVSACRAGACEAGAQCISARRCAASAATAAPPPATTAETPEPEETPAPEVEGDEPASNAANCTAVRGAPAPGTGLLGLMAAGLGALAARRRRSVAHARRECGRLAAG